MSPETDLRDRLERELEHLPAVPAQAYLREGRRARRRRTVAVAAPAAAVAVLALAGAIGAGGQGRDLSLAQEPTTSASVPAEPAIDYSADPDFVAPEPNNALEAQDGLAGIDFFTTDEIPAWAREYGNHGPVAYAPDGRLWVAPDATVMRAVVNPLTYGKDDGAPSIAVEARCACAPEEMQDDVVWVWISPTDGTMDVPAWTNGDFELWVDGATASAQGRPTIAERFAHFADKDSGRMVAGAPGVTLVQQEAEADLGSGQVTHTRAGAAEVEYAGKTFYVVGVDPEEGAPWFRWWPGDTEPDFASFLTMLKGNWT